jgi:hypothetical protein
MAPSPDNSFFWSFARHSLFEECPRAYWFAYRGAWGGWDPAAPSRARVLYTLKRLSTRQQWAGSHVHDAIAEVLLHRRDAMPELLRATWVEETVSAMREEFRLSRAGAWRTDPVRHPGLYEHAYSLDVPPEAWAAERDRVASCLEGFLSHGRFAFLRALPQSDLLAVEPKKAAFELPGGLTVRAIPDVVFRDAGGIAVWDWKSGGDAAALARHRRQLAVYALFVRETFGEIPRAAAINPATDEAAEFAFTAEDLDETAAWIVSDAEDILFPAEEAAAEGADEESAHDFATGGTACATCVFAAVCPKMRQPPPQEGTP